MEQTQPIKNSAGKIILFSCLFSFTYTIMRYHIFGPVPWKDLAFFTLNKGISLSAFVILSFNFSFGPLNNLGIKVPEGFLSARKALGMTGFLLVLIHGFMSFLIFKPHIYAQFFLENNTLSLVGGLSMMGGILACIVLWGYNLSFQTSMKEDKKFIQFITSRKFLLTAMLFSAVHLYFMGYKGWTTPEHWHGGLPPISLVSFVIFVLMYVINLLGRKK